MDVGSARSSTSCAAEVWATMSVVKEDLEKASRSSVQGDLHYPEIEDCEPYTGGICTQKRGSGLRAAFLKGAFSDKGKLSKQRQANQFFKLRNNGEKFILSCFKLSDLLLLNIRMNV